MTYLLAGIIVAWLCGLFFFAGRYLNDIRQVLNNIAAGAPSENRPSQPRLLHAAVTTLPFALSFQELVAAAAMLMIGRSFGLDRPNAHGITGIDPARLTEAGRVHLKRTVRQERILIAWMLGGFILLVWASTYFLTS